MPKIAVNFITLGCSWDAITLGQQPFKCPLSSLNWLLELELTSQAILKGKGPRDFQNPYYCTFILTICLRLTLHHEKVASFAVMSVMGNSEQMSS